MSAAPQTGTLGALQSPEVRVSVAGNVDSGKSTLVGVLTKGRLDDGRGSARCLVFNFSHEQQNGRTSSIALEMMGFDDSGHAIVSEHAGSSVGPSREKKHDTWPSIVRRSERVVMFVDLCGHEGYLKTTIYGLCQKPDYMMLVVNANAGVQKMTKEHLGIALGLGIPVFVVVTKVDMTPKSVYTTHLDALVKILKSPAVNKLPCVLDSKDESMIDQIASSLVVNRVVPIIPVSSVTGEGLDVLHVLLNKLQSRQQHKDKAGPAEFQIDSTFTVPGVGLVVSGNLTSGTVKVGTQLLLGPDKIGNFRPVGVRSIHSRRCNVDFVEAGHTAALAIKPIGKNRENIRKNNIRKGMCIATQQNAVAFWEFQADVVVMHHATTIRPGYQCMIHCGVVRQCAKIMDISGNVELARTGDRASIRFRFCFHPELVTVGEMVLFREGRTKGLGRITHVKDNVASITD